MVFEPNLFLAAVFRKIWALAGKGVKEGGRR